MIIPREKVAAERLNPKKFVLYSPPKMGKTTLLSHLDNCLIIDLEEGSVYLNALRIKINSLAELIELGKAIKDANFPYWAVAVDTITKLEEWCEADATVMYKKSVQGKNFEGKTVLELPNGAGYLWLRESYKKWMDFIEKFAENIIFVGHIKDKSIEKAGKEVMAKDLDLTGKIKQITCANADAIAYMYRDKEGRMFLNFKSSDEINCGSRCDHLKGQEILIAEQVEGETPGTIKAYWDKIYLK